MLKMKNWIVFVLVFSIFIYASAEFDAKKVEIDSKKLVKFFGGRRLKGKWEEIFVLKSFMKMF